MGSEPPFLRKAAKGRNEPSVTNAAPCTNSRKAGISDIGVCKGGPSSHSSFQTTLQCCFTEPAIRCARDIVTFLDDWIAGKSTISLQGLQCQLPDGEALEHIACS